MQDFVSIRKSSWEYVEALGLPVLQTLPALERAKLRETAEVENRLFGMLAVAAASYGFPREDALRWLKQEGILVDDFLASQEIQFLKSGTGPIDLFKAQIEAMWALSWALSLVDALDARTACANDFVSRLPDLAQFESSEPTRNRTNLRAAEQLTRELDRYYCLQWAITQAGESKDIALYVVANRRLALEWLHDRSKDWDSISLDT